MMAERELQVMQYEQHPFKEDSAVVELVAFVTAEGVIVVSSVSILEKVGGRLSSQHSSPCVVNLRCA